MSRLGGWDADGGGIVGPMITYLLPILIGYTGGRMAYGDDNIRGGVVGAIATMGAVTGADVPMFLGAMIMGPLGGYTMRRLDALWDGKIRPGFEMLVNNFSAGIWGMILAIFGFLVAGPFVDGLLRRWPENVVDFLVDNSLLPLTSIFVEPAKVLFLNNAINHGIFTPLGTTEAAEQGKSILFLIEANPGPGLGLLLAFTRLRQGHRQGVGTRRGRHPVLRRHPRDLLPLRADEAQADPRGDPRRHDRRRDQPDLRLRPAGSRRPGLDHRGLAPGAGRQPRGRHAVGDRLRPACRFAVASVLLKMDRAEDEGDLAAATASMESMKGKKSARLLGARRRGRSSSDQVDRVRLRRRHGLVRDGCLGAAQEDPRPPATVR